MLHRFIASVVQLWLERDTTPWDKARRYSTGEIIAGFFSMECGACEKENRRGKRAVPFQTEERRGRDCTATPRPEQLTDKLNS